MEIKKAVYENIMVEQRRVVSQAVYGCDNCKKEIPNYPNEANRLDMTIFHNEKESERKHFCSWGCVLGFLPKIKSDYFINLPMVYMDQERKGMKELLKALKSLNKK